jgi:hypothetical protein
MLVHTGAKEYMPGGEGEVVLDVVEEPVEIGPVTPAGHDGIRTLINEHWCGFDGSPPETLSGTC